MKSKFISSLFVATLLALSCSQVFAWGDYGSRNHRNYQGCEHQTVSVFESSSLALLGIGLLGVAVIARMKKIICNLLFKKAYPKTGFFASVV